MWLLLNMAIFGIYLKFIGGNPLTFLGTNISFSQGMFESIIFRLSRLVGYVTFLEGITWRIIPVSK